MRSYWVVPVVHLAQYFVSTAKGDVIQGQHVSLVIYLQSISFVLL